ncbi:CoA transferase [Hoyosella sp. YIM 151337]|uniref:CaiB/BaiF CoA transferase family protein n=1 Tax=Hoyosella sp. YIM 151337 TaxID=2992742 RepID=UPI0022358C51|nr:CaiB/BaiF CoA-transferase family protein [Hoyosella sp. YIM 151337]MCW4352840.1 CoA transferase [Hoyosella sp. YIM 151337]
MPGPLEGVRVVEMAGLAPGPFGCMLLADLGAEVLRIERAGGGGGIVPPQGPMDRGKRSVAVDLKSAAGRELVHKLAAEADVFVEGYRPGVAERLGIGPEDLRGVNPRLIYGRITGWGQDGPLAPRAGHDINYAAISGGLDLLGRAGEPPTPPANILADFAGGGMLLALGILAALHERQTSGTGQVVDAAMVDGAAVLTTFMHGMHAHGLWNGERGTNLLDGGAACYGTYETADGGFMAVGALEPQFWAELVAKLELDAEELPFHLDLSQAEKLREILAEKFRTRTLAEWSELFADSDACVTPVVPAWEAHKHPHNAARNTYIEVDGVVQPAPAPRFSRTPAGTPAAASGAADAEAQSAILADWGLSTDAIAAVRDGGGLG